MISERNQSSHAQWLEKIHAALIRARNRAKEIARQTGTPLIYVRDGEIVREDVAESTKQQTAIEG